MTKVSGDEESKAYFYGLKDIAGKYILLCLQYYFFEGVNCECSFSLPYWKEKGQVYEVEISTKRRFLVKIREIEHLLLTLE